MSIFKSFLEYIKATKYNIGFVETPLKDIIDGCPIKVNWLKHSYTDRWFADPFILDVTDYNMIVLVEEWYDPIQRGRITKLRIDKRTYSLIDCKPILELDTHLSFPAIQRQGGKIYITPESSATGRLLRYEFNPITDEMIPDSVVCEDRLTDAVFFCLQGRDYMFSTRLPDANGKELGVYTKQTDGKYVLSTVCHFPENTSRMAGNFFDCNGIWYRPAQVCIKSYGDAVSLQKVEYDQGRWSFSEVRRIYSPHPNFELGFHTFNVYGDTIVVDALGFRRPVLSHFLQRLKHCLK